MGNPHYKLIVLDGWAKKLYITNWRRFWAIYSTCVCTLRNKYLNILLLLTASVVAAKLISDRIMLISKRRWCVPDQFMMGPVVMLGYVPTLKLVNEDVMFLIGPEVSGHFLESWDLELKEVYQFNVPTFGPGVVFDIDYSIRQEQVSTLVLFGDSSWRAFGCMFMFNYTFYVFKLILPFLLKDRLELWHLRH